LNTLFTELEGKLKYLLLISLVIALASCGPSEADIKTAIGQTQALWTSVPTQTSYPTYTLQPEIIVTKLVIVTQTFTPTPIYTSTITQTPTSTGTATATPNFTLTNQAIMITKLRAPKGNGFYLVNVDIAPGVWRSDGTQDDCYWAVTTKTGDIIDNHFGMAGGTAYISPSAFQVEFNDCGTWTFVSAP
jgi:hypothetical protein